MKVLKLNIYSRTDAVNTYFSSVIKPGIVRLARDMKNYNDVSFDSQNDDKAIYCEINLKLA